MQAILMTKPKTTFKLHQPTLTYQQIQHAIENKHTNRFLQGIVSTAKANPQTCVFVIYKTNSDSVLLVWGLKPYSVIVEGDKVRRNLQNYTEKDYLYVFSHCKD